MMYRGVVHLVSVVVDQVGVVWIEAEIAVVEKVLVVFWVKVVGQRWRELQKRRRIVLG